MNLSEGYQKKYPILTDNHVLLAGGGNKSLDEFYHTGNLKFDFVTSNSNIQVQKNDENKLFVAIPTYPDGNVTTALVLSNSATGISNYTSATNNTNTYINLIEGGIIDRSIKITGSSNINVATSYNSTSKVSTLTINGPDLSSYLTSHQTFTELNTKLSFAGTVGGIRNSQLKHEVISNGTVTSTTNVDTNANLAVDDYKAGIYFIGPISVSGNSNFATNYGSAIRVYRADKGTNTSTARSVWELFAPVGSNTFYFRNSWNRYDSIESNTSNRTADISVWNDWYEVLHAGNYTSYVTLANLGIKSRNLTIGGTDYPVYSSTNTTVNVDNIYLQLSGGTISNSNYGPLTIKRTNTNYAGIRFENSNGALGSISMRDVNGSLVRWNAAATTSYTVLDTSNLGGQNDTSNRKYGVYSSDNKLYVSVPSDSFDDVYVRLNPGAAEQTIESSIGTINKGIVQFYRSSGDHYAFITFANKVDNQPRILGGIGFASAGVDKLQFRTAGGSYYDIFHTNNAKWANLSVTTSAKYNTEPEFKSVKIGNGTASTAATKSCQQIYDATNQCLKFIFV